MRILLVTPPLTQLNTPYPATPYLAGYLKSIGYEVGQLDLGIELIDRLFRGETLEEVIASVDATLVHTHADARFLAMQGRYVATVDSVINFLRGGDVTIANLIAKRGYLPEGDRFKNLADLEYSFGEMGIIDKAKYLATLYIQDISDFIRRNVSPHFELIRYAESLCVSLPSFDLLQQSLNATSNPIDDLIVELFREKVEAFKPSLVGFSVPFPGNLYGGLLCAKWLKDNLSSIKVMMGGGYVGTELRNLSDTRLFDYIDYLIFDDGELSIRRLVEYLDGRTGAKELVRTVYRSGNSLVKMQNIEEDIKHNERSAPLYNQLPINKYIDLIDTANPMLKLWSDGRWNKLMLAHGCYWAKCAFCDVSLDYISRFDAADATRIVDIMEEVIAQTGHAGFHFVDEAAPPVLLKKISLEIISRGLNVSWWANIRFEKNFTYDLCKLMARAGCIAVSGGLEVASDRLLKLMDKGVDIKQAALVTDAFSKSGILVHAYLMYGFPSETTQETIDSLEVVRQLFEQNLVQSAFWHRFAMTVHSPVGLNPEQYGAKCLKSGNAPFANNEISFADKSGTDLQMLGEGLRKSLYNYMHRLGYEKPLHTWFDGRVPHTSIAPTLIQGYLVTYKSETLPDRGVLVWLGDGYQLLLTDSRRPKLHIFNQGKQVEAILRPEEIGFWENFFSKLEESSGFLPIEDLKELANAFFTEGEGALVRLKVWKSLRKNGLVVV